MATVLSEHEWYGFLSDETLEHVVKTLGSLMAGTFTRIVISGAGVAVTTNCNLLEPIRVAWGQHTEYRAVELMISTPRGACNTEYLPARQKTEREAENELETAERAVLVCDIRGRVAQIKVQDPDRNTHQLIIIAD
jgi:hypothetical protein